MEHARLRVLVADVGGTNVKVSGTGRTDVIKVPSGPELTASAMADGVKAALAGWEYDAVSIGFPGPVANGRPTKEPANLGPGWVGFDYEAAFGRPVRVVNDAAMQAIGSYQGGRMLFLGLGTGLGSALVLEGVLGPLELAHLPYRHEMTYEDYLGLRGYKRMGKEKWQRHVERVCAMLYHAMQVDYIVLGGGQTKKLTSLPAGVRLGSNACAILGGIRIWNDAATTLRHATTDQPVGALPEAQHDAGQPASARGRA